MQVMPRHKERGGGAGGWRFLRQSVGDAQRKPPYKCHKDLSSHPYFGREYQWTTPFVYFIQQQQLESSIVYLKKMRKQ